MFKVWEWKKVKPSQMADKIRDRVSSEVASKDKGLGGRRNTQHQEKNTYIDKQEKNTKLLNKEIQRKNKYKNFDE